MDFAIKKVTGYQAPDGSTHPTAKAAAAHAQELAVRKQIEAFAKSLTLEDAGVSIDEERGRQIGQAGLTISVTHDLQEFLFEHRESILNALAVPKVRQRKPRTQKAGTGA